MKEKLIEILTKQKEMGNSFIERLNKISNTPDIDKLIGEYEQWNIVNKSVLEKAFVHQQLFRMYSGVSFLGNVNISENSFQGKRDKLIYCLPKQINHLTTAINVTININLTDLLPFDEDVSINIANTNSTNNNMKKIFISHSSKDDKKIKPLIDLLENIGVPHNQIFYSSHPAYGVKLGENIFDRLKKELNSDILSLFMLSENFYKSPVCLCEMGAVWIKTNKQIPILIPPFDFKDVDGGFPNSLGFKINDKDQLNSFKSEIEDFFSLSPIHFSRWEEKRDEYLTKINGLI